jgi:hypothetical protein
LDELRGHLEAAWHFTQLSGGDSASIAGRSQPAVAFRGSAADPPRQSSSIIAMICTEADEGPFSHPYTRNSENHPWCSLTRGRVLAHRGNLLLTAINSLDLEVRTHVPEKCRFSPTGCQRPADCALRDGAGKPSRASQTIIAHPTLKLNTSGNQVSAVPGSALV